MTVRILTLFLVFLPALGLTAEGPTAPGPPYEGRSVADVIDEFRASGEPFAYSTSLVGDNLRVLDEPEPGEPVDIVRQILAPHGLTVRRDSGVFLVVRIRTEVSQSGSLLLVVTMAGGEPPDTTVSVAVEPMLSHDDLRQGVYEFTDVPPGRYELLIEAEGFSSARRVVDVWPGERKYVPVPLETAKAELEIISVSASRYEILREIAASSFTLDQRTIQTMPDLGEDPVRIVQRLPGAAASGASAKMHLRGGEAGEIGIMLNGQRLFDPFHVRDYQSVFSAIDSRAIEGVEVYTGGFPVLFGNRMSGMVLMESLDALDSRHTEIGLSVYNASLLTAGRDGDREWLFSARRGNLDLVIDPQFGSPSYFDVFGEFAYELTANATLSFNALYAEDRVEIILESEPEELERVVSDTRNAQAWIRLDNRWSENLSSRTILSAVSFDNFRRGSLNDEEKLVATGYDDRKITQGGFRQDFSYTHSDRHHVRWGLEIRYGDATYDYRNTAEYFGLQALFEGRDEPASRRLAATPDGAAYAAYLSDRWKLSERSIVEWGLRWDDQTYTDESSDAQLSPRLSLLRTVGPATELRLSWGRYYQAQEINELQIEDGILNYWPAQRADHYIAGVRHVFADKYSLRVEAFHKDIARVRPRFENLFDPLGLIPEVQSDRVRLDPSSAQANGFEVSVDRFDGAFNWWASYVLSEVTDRIGGRDELRSWDQRHAFQGGLSWSNEKWDLALAGSVHTGWPLTELSLIEDGIDDEGEPVFIAVPGPRNAGRYPTFASLDFRVSRRWKLPRGSLMAFLEVTNLSNRRNICCLDFDFDEDEVTGEEVFERGVDYWMGILPAIGILWEF